MKSYYMAVSNKIREIGAEDFPMIWPHYKSPSDEILVMNGS